MAPIPAIVKAEEGDDEQMAEVVEATPAIIASSPPTLSLSGEHEYASLPCNKAYESLLCVSTIRAPALVIDESSRAGMDVVAVIDKSGSMNGEKMDMTKKTLDLMIDNLTSRDRLAIVCYSDEVETIFDFTAMNNDGKNIARQSIKERIHAGGMTNLSGGLIQGCSLVTKRAERNDVCSVLLMTDGLANRGVSGKRELVDLTTNLVKSFTSPATIYTFGFGSDHDADLLTNIAKAGGGTYYFMRSADAVPEAFADCMGGLMSVMAQSITLTVNVATEGVVINSIPTQFKTNTIKPGQEYVLQIGDIFSEETRDIIVNIKLPALAAPDTSFTPLVFKLEYFNVAAGVPGETVEFAAVLPRTHPDSANGEQSIAVDEQRNRIRTAQAMEEAKRLADLGQLERARNVLTATHTSVAASCSAAAPTVQKLSADLAHIQTSMFNPEVYQQQGQYKLASKGRKHWMQREAEVDSDEGLSYVTSAKSAARSAFKK